MMLSRRQALIGSLAAFVAAPAIVRVGSIMPVRALPVEAPPVEFLWMPRGYGAAVPEAAYRTAVDGFILALKRDGLIGDNTVIRLA